MDHFEQACDIANLEQQGEEFNAFICQNLQDCFSRMTNKLLIDFIQPNEKEYTLNRRGAKVFFASSRIPLLKFINGTCKCVVLSVGITKEGIPLYKIPQLKNQSNFSVSISNNSLAACVCVIVMSDKMR